MNFYARTILLLSTTVLGDAIEITHLKQCCDKNVTIISSKYCQDGKPTSVQCDDTETLLTFDDQYEISEDSHGVYVDTFEPNTIIREPNFCLGGWNMSTYPDKRVVVVCGDKYWSKRPSESTFYDVLLFATTLLNLGSFAALLLTAFLYYYLPILQDVHSTCAFHFTLNSGIWHGMLAYRLLFQYKLFEMKPTLCITNVYVWGYVGLASFCWSAILSLDTWNQSKGNHFVDENGLRLRYKIFGYGMPALLILASNIHYYVGHYNALKLDFSCYRHQNLLLVFYMVLPITLILILNCFFFADSQRRFVKMYASQPNSTVRVLRYRLYINARLFFIMGIPWSLGMLIAVYMEFGGGGRWIHVPLVITYILTSSEGISVFLILVAFRKRILREIATSNIISCMKVPEKWKTLQDSETTEESDNELRHNPPNFENFTERSFISLAQEAHITLS